MSFAEVANDPIDVVYMWVDDSLPGYRETLARYAKVAVDLSPNRTRDNLDTLKYSLRSVRMYAPWVRHIYLVCCAPQHPHWMAQETPGLTIIRHEAILDADVLPTFNSFAISSALNRIPGIAKRYFKFDDDEMLTAPVTPADFADGKGRLRLFRRFGHTPGAELRDGQDLTPWNASLAYTNHLLDGAFGKRSRPTFSHAPLFIDRDWWEEMVERWPDDFARTRASRFRDRHNVVSSYLYPYFLLGTGRAAEVSRLRTYRDTFYFGVENYTAYAWWKLALARAVGAKTLCLNDNFGTDPNPRVVQRVRDFLEETYPVKSPFEI